MFLKLQELELQRQDAEKKAAKEKEAIELTSAYLNFLNAHIKEGAAQNPPRNPGQAYILALKDTLLAKGIGKSLAGAFKDGVERFRGEGTTTSDSNLVLLSDQESVVTASGTNQNPGLVTAMNKGKIAVENWFKETYFNPKTIEPALVMPRISDNDASVNEIKKVQGEIKKLAEVIKGKPEVSIDWNSHDERIERRLADGIKQTIRHVRSKPRI